MKMARPARAKRRFSGCVSVWLVLALGACDRPGEAADQEKQESQEREYPVVVRKLEQRSMRLAVRSAATIEAERKVELSAEASGILMDLRVQEGDPVRSGQLLARIKKEAQAASVQRARTNLAQAKREFDRVSKLAKQGVVGQQELDNARDRVQLARLDSRDRGRDLKNTTVKAPIEGVVTRRVQQAGTFVSAGSPLLEITDFSTLVARVYVPERELDRVAVGQSAQVVGKAALGRKASGRVLRISPVVDSATGTVKLTVGLPPQSLKKATDFRPGMYAEVTIAIRERPTVPAIPKSAVLYEDAASFVMVAREGIARRIPVLLGQREGDWVELREGLTPEDALIVAGQQNIKDGSHIKIVEAGNESARPTPIAAQEKGA